jgi:hypothetical protein
MLLKLLHKYKREGMLANSFYEDGIILLSKPEKDSETITKETAVQFP